VNPFEALSSLRHPYLQATRYSFVRALCRPMAAGLLLAGCQHYQPAPMDVAQSAHEFAARRLDSAQVREFVEALAGTPVGAHWDRAQLLAAALAQNPRLAVARSQMKLAAAEQALAVLGPNPDLTLQSEYARQELHPWLYGLAASWPLLSTAQRRLNGQMASAETERAKLEAMQAAWEVRGALIQALSDRESARRARKLLDETLRAQASLLDIQRARIEAGETSADSALPAEQARAALEQERAELDTRAVTATAELAAALGVSDEALRGIEIRWPDWGDPPAPAEAELKPVRERALLSRAELAAAIQDYAVAEAQLAQAIRRQYPGVTLQPGYYWDHGIAKLPFNLELSLPMRGTQQRIAAARAGRELAGEKLMAVQAQIGAQIDTALARERQERLNLESARRQLESAKRAQQVARELVRSGAEARDESASADITALRAELQWLQRRSQLQAARNALEQALNAPLSGPELGLAADWTRLQAGRVP